MRLINAININLFIIKCELQDGSTLIINDCKYPLYSIKAVQTGYNFYNQYGFFNKNYDDIKNANYELSIIKKLQSQRLFELIETPDTNNNNSISTIFKKFIIDNEINLDINLQSFLHILLEFCNSSKNIENKLFFSITKIIIKYINNSKTEGFNPKYNINDIQLHKLYDYEKNKMSSFNKKTLQFEYIHIPKYIFNTNENIIRIE